MSYRESQLSTGFWAISTSKTLSCIIFSLPSAMSPRMKVDRRLCVFAHYLIARHRIYVQHQFGCRKNHRLTGVRRPSRLHRVEALSPFFLAAVQGFDRGVQI